MKPDPDESQLFENEYITIHCKVRERIVVVRRSGIPFRNRQDLDETTAEFARVFPIHRRRGFSILNDVRQGPVTVHQFLEPAHTRFRKESERGFDRSAIVVSTLLGRVRSSRLAAGVGLPMVIVDSMEEALAFLTAR